MIINQKIRLFVNKSAIAPGDTISLRFIADQYSGADNNEFSLLLLSNEGVEVLKLMVVDITKSILVEIPEELSFGSCKFVLHLGNWELDAVSLFVVEKVGSIMLNLYNIGIQYRMISDRMLDLHCYGSAFQYAVLAENYYVMCGYMDLMAEGWIDLGQKYMRMGCTEYAKRCLENVLPMVIEIGSDNLKAKIASLKEQITNSIDVCGGNCMSDCLNRKSSKINMMVLSWQMFDWFDFLVETGFDGYDYVSALLVWRESRDKDIGYIRFRELLEMLYSIVMEYTSLLDFKMVRFVMNDVRQLFLDDIDKKYLDLYGFMYLISVQYSIISMPQISALYASRVMYGTNKDLIDCTVGVRLSNVMVEYRHTVTRLYKELLFSNLKVSDYNALQFIKEIAEKWDCDGGGEYLADIVSFEIVRLREHMDGKLELTFGSNYWHDIRSDLQRVYLEKITDSVMDRISDYYKKKLLEECKSLSDVKKKALEMS